MMRRGRGRWGSLRYGQEPPGPVKRTTVRRVVSSFRPYKRKISVVALAIIFTSALGVVNPLLIKVIFDTALFCDSGCPDMSRLYGLVALMIAIPIVSGSIGIGQTYLANQVGQRVMQDLRNALYGHLQRMPLRFFTSTRTGEIQSRLSNDVGGVQSVVTDTASAILSNIVILISTLVAMLILSWQLTVLSLILTPLFIYLTARVGKARAQVAASTQQSLAEISAITEETLSVSGILLTKAFGRQRHEISRFGQENARLAELQIRQQMIGRSFFAVVQIFFSITPALVYLVAGWVNSGTLGGGLAPAITAGSIVAFTTLQSRLFFPVGQMLQVSVEVRSSMALFDRIYEYLDMGHEIIDRPGAVALTHDAVRGEVRFDHVFFRYEPPPEASEAAEGSQEGREPAPEANREAILDAEQGAPSGDDQESAAADQRSAAGPDGPVPTSNGSPPAGAGEPPVRANGGRPAREWTLADVDFDIRPGQLAALVGPSGAGKTTMTYLVPRLYDVVDGAVTIDGLDVRDATLESLGQVIGVVTQETYLFHQTVRQNLMYGRPEATDAQMVAAAKAAFIHDRIMELGDGYDTVVGERGYRLSGGEKQRLAIARVILKDPRILILDEATSSLDTTSERLVQEALRPLMEGRTTIAIAHRLSTILAADVIFVIDRGEVVERGTHAELLERGGLYAQLYQQQFQSGEVEAEYEDGVVLSAGEVIPTPRAS